MGVTYLSQSALFAGPNWDTPKPMHGNALGASVLIVLIGGQGSEQREYPPISLTLLLSYTNRTLRSNRTKPAESTTYSCPNCPKCPNKPTPPRFHDSRASHAQRECRNPRLAVAGCVSRPIAGASRVPEGVSGGRRTPGATLNPCLGIDIDRQGSTPIVSTGPLRGRNRHCSDASLAKAYPEGRQ